VVDACGLPVRLMLTPGQASDKTAFPQLIQGLSLARDVVADRGFFARSIIDLIEAGGAAAHIPSQSNVRIRRLVDPDIYRQRNLVERFFNKLKHFRRVATRFDKLARNYLAAVLLAATRLWTRAYESTT
jgi:transposase